jgi:serine/threonine-protein kinase HipA
MEQKKLKVYLHNNIIGTLTQNKSGDINFSYSGNAQNILSLSLPIGQKLFNNDECFGYFDGLLPESQSSRKFIAQKYAINPDNDFALLEKIGRDCAGAVSFYNENEAKKTNQNNRAQGIEISERELSEFIKQLPLRPLFTDISGFRLSLAGAQDKAAISIIDDKICIPIDDTPTTHIIKPAMHFVESSIENEYLCMKAAQKLGIDAAETFIKYAADTKYLLIKRYDRKIIDNTIIERVHQEDFCQADAIRSSKKYEIDGGIGFKKCFELLRKLSNPVLDINKFVNLIAFNFLIGNNDAHGKNFSILHDNQKLAFAPAYDILCTRIYPGISTTMAMKIGNKDLSSALEKKDFEEFCKNVNVSFKLIKETILNQSAALPDILKKEIKNLKQFEKTSKTINLMYEFISKNCENAIEIFK